MKRPSFQFYPGDWLRDTALRTCSCGARGLWIDMLCFMHEGTPYGHLKVGDKVIHPVNLASMVGAPIDTVEGWLEELRTAHVYDIGDDGAIYSRRMIRDEEVRQKRAAGGHKGGNPALKGKKDAADVGPKVNLAQTPSSSSSSPKEREAAGPPSSQALGKTAIAADWNPVESDLAWANTARPDLGIDVVTAKFRAHHQARHTLLSDWAAEWRKWVLNEKAGAAPASSQGWWSSLDGETAKARELGVPVPQALSGNDLIRMRAALWIAAGDGPWWDDKDSAYDMAVSMRNCAASSSPATGVDKLLAGLDLRATAAPAGAPA